MAETNAAATAKTQEARRDRRLGIRMRFRPQGNGGNNRKNAWSAVPAERAGASPAAGAIHCAPPASVARDQTTRPKARRASWVGEVMNETNISIHVATTVSNHRPEFPGTIASWLGEISHPGETATPRLAPRPDAGISPVRPIGSPGSSSLGEKGGATRRKPEPATRLHYGHPPAPPTSIAPKLSSVAIIYGIFSQINGTASREKQRAQQLH